MRFYTMPPAGIEYPYLLVNPRNYRELFRHRFRHAILDCGVEAFKHDPSLRDYPKSFLASWRGRARQLSEIFGERLWIVIPDYMDDYHPGQFGDNVEKTLRNIENFIAADGVNWLPVIQSRYLNRFSFMEACQRTREVIGDYPRVAVGTVCKTNNLGFIEYCCRVARRFFPGSWIHAFGLTLKALPRVVGSIMSWDSLVPECGRTKWRYWLLDSFDSSAYTFPRQPHRSSCGSLTERQKFFYAYLERLRRIVEVEN
jgi:hypothetical protein